METLIAQQVSLFFSFIHRYKPNTMLRSLHLKKERYKMKTYALSQLVIAFGDSYVLNYTAKRKDKITCSTACLHYILKHFSQTITHRKWLYLMFVLIADSIESVIREQLLELVLIHDLSKFSAVEALGYGLKFGRPDGLVKEKEKNAWENALHHHYEHNPHHPPSDPGKNMHNIYLLESLIDMLACRVERVLSMDETTTPEAIFKVPDTFLERYTDRDKKRARFHLNKWSDDVTLSPHRKELAQALLHYKIKK